MPTVGKDYPNPVGWHWEGRFLVKTTREEAAARLRFGMDSWNYMDHLDRTPPYPVIPRPIDLRGLGVVLIEAPQRKWWQIWH